MTKTMLDARLLAALEGLLSKYPRNATIEDIAAIYDPATAEHVRAAREAVDIAEAVRTHKREADAPAFEPEDFAHTATLLRENMKGRGAVFQAVCSNNLSIILAALDACSEDVGGTP